MLSAGTSPLQLRGHQLRQARPDLDMTETRDMFILPPLVSSLRLYSTKFQLGL